MQKMTKRKVVLLEEDILSLESFIQDVPYRWATWLVSFLNKKVVEDIPTQEQKLQQSPPQPETLKNSLESLKKMREKIDDDKK